MYEDGKHTRKLLCGRDEAQLRSTVSDRRGTTEDYHLREAKDNDSHVTPHGKRGVTKENYDVGKGNTQRRLPCLREEEPRKTTMWEKRKYKG